MSFLVVSRLFRETKLLTTPVQYALTKCGYAAPGGGLGKARKGKKGMGGPGKIALPVETDAHKLQTYCCGSNIYKEGEDVKLKPESEYPDWLWEIRTGDPPKLEELDPNTKAYWRKLRRIALTRVNLQLTHKPKKTSYKI